MSTKTYASDTAFPVVGDTCDEFLGLTKREYFAAMALQAVDQQHFLLCEEIAGRAVDIADELIARLNQEPKTP